MKKLLLILIALPMIGFGQPQYQLDSITTNINSDVSKYTYDSQGRCYKETWDRWQNIIEFIYSYDSNNNLSEVQMMQTNISGTMTDMFKYIYSYDSNNNMIEVEEYIWNTTQYILKSTITYNYNTSNQIIISEQHDASNIQMWRAEATWQAGTLVLQIQYSWDSFNNTWSDTTKLEYLYSNMNLYQINHYNYQNNRFFLIDSEYFSCNSIPLVITAYGFFEYPASMNIIAGNIFTNQITEYSDSSGTSYCHYSPWSGGTSSLSEYTKKTKLICITDILGRETKGKKNQPLFYIYNDGTVEKRIVIE